MFKLDRFISDSITFRPVSMFAADIEANKEKLTEDIKGKKVCVIGSAGSIGRRGSVSCMSTIFISLKLC